jgi:hypothetical protein
MVLVAWVVIICVMICNSRSSKTNVVTLAVLCTSASITREMSPSFLQQSTVERRWIFGGYLFLSYFTNCGHRFKKDRMHIRVSRNH